MTGSARRLQKPKNALVFADRLLAWWAENKRSFPWRKTNDPYEVLVAEVLLRKTTSRQVNKIYRKFLSEFPTPVRLAGARVGQIKKLIEPLGMEHKRAFLLKKLGEEIAVRHRGRVPSRAEELLGLPGVGRYAAHAVLCLAYGRGAAMVDTNVTRVVTRFFGFKSTKARPKDDPSLWSFVESLIPPGRAREFNLALLDFAAKVCTARKPRCRECILRDLCYFRREAGTTVGELTKSRAKKFRAPMPPELGRGKSAKSYTSR